jgi:hypothetical protein
MRDRTPLSTVLAFAWAVGSAGTSAQNADAPPTLQFQDRINQDEEGCTAAVTQLSDYLRLRSEGRMWQALLAEAMLGIDSDLDPLKPQPPTVRAPVPTFLRDEDLVRSVKQRM